MDIVFITLFTGLIFLLTLIGGVLLTALLQRGSLDQWQPFGDVRFLLLVQTAGFIGGLAFAGLWISSMYGASFWKALGLRRFPFGLLIALGMAGAVLSIFVQAAQKYLPIPKTLPIDRVFNPHDTWALAIYGTILAPFFEECYFRGLLYPSLRRFFREGFSAAELRDWRRFFWIAAAAFVPLTGILALYRYLRAEPWRYPLTACLLALLAGLLADPLLRLWSAVASGLRDWIRPEYPAMVLTGLAFGVAHGDQLGFSWAPMLLIGVVGFIFTYARERTGSIVPSWIMHSCYNGILFVLLFHFTKGFHDFSQLPH